MKKTLYLKFILAYFIFGFFGFLFITFFVPDVTSKQLIKEKSQDLYSEAILISDNYASDLYSKEITLAEVKEQLDELDEYYRNMQ